MHVAPFVFNVVTFLSQLVLQLIQVLNFNFLIPTCSYPGLELARPTTCYFSSVHSFLRLWIQPEFLWCQPLFDDPALPHGWVDLRSFALWFLYIFVQPCIVYLTSCWRAKEFSHDRFADTVAPIFWCVINPSGILDFHNFLSIFPRSDSTKVSMEARISFGFSDGVQFSKINQLKRISASRLSSSKRSWDSTNSSISDILFILVSIFSNRLTTLSSSDFRETAAFVLISSSFKLSNFLSISAISFLWLWHRGCSWDPIYPNSNLLLPYRGCSRNPIFPNSSFSFHQKSKNALNENWV